MKNLYKTLWISLFMVLVTIPAKAEDQSINQNDNYQNFVFRLIANEGVDNNDFAVSNLIDGDPNTVTNFTPYMNVMYDPVPAKVTIRYEDVFDSTFPVEVSRWYVKNISNAKRATCEYWDFYRLYSTHVESFTEANNNDLNCMKDISYMSYEDFGFPFSYFSFLKFNLGDAIDSTKPITVGELYYEIEPLPFKLYNPSSIDNNSPKYYLHDDDLETVWKPDAADEDPEIEIELYQLLENFDNTTFYLYDFTLLDVKNMFEVTCNYYFYSGKITSSLATLKADGIQLNAVCDNVSGTDDENLLTKVSVTFLDSNLLDPNEVVSVGDIEINGIIPALIGEPLSIGVLPEELKQK